MAVTSAADPIDQVFRALADPTRRRIVERLGRGAASVGELAQPFEMALPSFVQHLRVLEACGLVRSKKTGRVRVFHVVPRRISVAQTWIDRQRDQWERRFDQLDDLLITLKERGA
jgi:DNA-binding transcriptional ArsR family regulator